jgi:Domain of unknown function (DUF4185)
MIARNRFLAAVFSSLFCVSYLGSPYIVLGEDLRKPFSVKSAAPDPSLTKAFHSDARWCGADGACSVSIDEATTVWFFGDTFVRKGGQSLSKSSLKSKSQLRSKSQVQSKSQLQSSSQLQLDSQMASRDSADSFEFINNSVAVQKINSATMKFFWRTFNGSPHAVLNPKAVATKSYYWPGDGFVLDEKLFVVNKVIEPRVAKKAGDFGFDWKADDLFQITNGGAAPTSWQWKSVSLPEHQKTALMGTALLLKDDYAYFYSSLQKFARGPVVHPTGVARIPNKALLSMDMSKFEYWNGQKWVPDINEASVIIEDGASEMTVTQLEGEPYLVLTYMAPMSSAICMRFAKKPEGPWSNPLLVYQCPEHLEVVLDRRTSCYSAKAHPEFSSNKDEVVVSYCPNPGEMRHYLARPDLYYPRVIRIALRKLSAQ